MIRLALRTLILAAVALLVGGTCARAFAQVAAPTVVEIVSATAYYDVLDRGDSSVAVVVLYHIDYDEDDLPTQSIDELLAIQLSGPDGTLVVSQPYPYTNDGYGYGVVGFFVPDPSGLTTSSALTVSVVYLPGYISTSIDHQTTVEWEDKRNLEAGIAAAVRRVEASTNGGLTLLDGSDHLTPDGIAYARNAIPYLRTLAPGLYSQQLRDVQVTRVDVGETYADELADTGGSAAWRTQFNSTADWLGQPVIMISTFVVFIIGAVAAWYAQKLAKSPLVTLPTMTIALAGGAVVGWVHLGFLALIGFFAALVFMFVVILKRAS